MTRCNGLDPAYPGLSCYLERGHPERCEFMTEALGIEWRQRAINAETQVAGWKTFFNLDQPEDWRHTLSYAVIALEGSADRGDQYCAAQIRAAIGMVKGEEDEEDDDMGMDPHGTHTVYLTPEERLHVLQVLADVIASCDAGTPEGLQEIQDLAELLVKVSKS